MRGPANQSLSPIEPVSVAPKRKLKNDEQRPGPEKRPSRARRLRIGAQRLRRASLTHRNVGASRTPGNRSAETGLAGWSERIRTHAFPIELSLCALSLEFGNICRLAAQKQGNECSRSLAPARSRRMRAQLTCSLNRRVRRRAKVDEQIAPNAMSNERCRRRRPIHSPRHQLYWQGLSGLVIGAIMTLATVAVPCSRPTCTS